MRPIWFTPHCSAAADWIRRSRLPWTRKIRRMLTSQARLSRGFSRELARASERLLRTRQIYTASATANAFLAVIAQSSSTGIDFAHIFVLSRRIGSRFRAEHSCRLCAKSGCGFERGLYRRRGRFVGLSRGMTIFSHSMERATHSSPSSIPLFRDRHRSSIRRLWEAPIPSVALRPRRRTVFRRMVLATFTSSARQLPLIFPPPGTPARAFKPFAAVVSNPPRSPTRSW